MNPRLPSSEWLRRVRQLESLWGFEQMPADDLLPIWAAGHPPTIRVESLSLQRWTAADLKPLDAP